MQAPLPQGSDPLHAGIKIGGRNINNLRYADDTNLMAMKDRDPGSIPGSGRSAGEGIGYPLQYSWASLVAQLVKNLSAVRETWV